MLKTMRKITTIFAILFLLCAGATLYFSGCSAQKVEAGVKYQCPMHPQIISDKPGKCPICSMDLVLMKAAAVGGKNPAGYSEVMISTEQEQLIGVKTDTVKRRPLSYVVRATGKIAHDPELYNTIIEYRLALTGGDKVSLDASRFKLEHMGLSKELIDEFGSAKEEPNYLLFSDKADGKLFVYAQIYESEINYVKKGQKMEITSLSLPGKVFTGKVKSLDTYLDPDTRTLRARAEIINTGGLLRPELFIHASIYADIGVRLSVPSDAVSDTGTRKIVFVRTNPGVYSPKEVTTGLSGEGFIEILTGLKEGEVVATAANFLLDSESRLKAIK